MGDEIVDISSACRTQMAHSLILQQNFFVYFLSYVNKRAVSGNQKYINTTYTA
jgi:hypothetical protein